MNDPLQKEFSEEFSTPTISVSRRYPTAGVHALTPAVFVEFDQMIDADEIMKHVKCTANKKSWPIVKLAGKELDEHPALAANLANATEGRWIAFAPVKPFGYDADISVTVGPKVRKF